MALLRRSSTSEDCEQDEDALLKSNWSRSIFPELKYSEEQELVLLGKWLQAEVQRHNRLYTKRQPLVPEAEFVVVAVQQAEKLYGHVLSEVRQKVAAAHAERGHLLETVWRGFTKVTRGAVLCLKDQNVAFSARSTLAEQKLAACEAALRKETDKLQADLDRATVQIQELKAANRAAAIAAAKRAFNPGQQSNTASAAPSGRASSPGLKQQGGLVQLDNPADAWSPPRSPDTATATPPALSGHATRPVISWDPRQVEAAAPSDAPQPRPASPKKTFVSVLPLVEEDSTGLSMARSLKSRTKRMSSMASSLLYKLEDDDLGTKMPDGDLEGLASQNAYLQEALETCRRDISSMSHQMAELERQAEHMVEVESRAEVAEGERDAALDKMALMTPRPALSPTIDLPKSLGPEGTSKFLAAINKHRAWPAAELAGMLVGVVVDGTTSLLDQARFAFGCLARPVYQRLLTQSNIVLLLQQGTTKPLAEHMTGQQFAWLQGHLGAMSADARRSGSPMLASFLIGCSEQGFRYSPDLYGSLVPYKEGLTVAEVTMATEQATVRTAERCNLMEEKIMRLREEVAQERERADRAAEAAATPAEAQHRREDTAQKRNPVLVYVEKLASSDEMAWTDFLDGMGTGPDIPKLFRHAGKLRNKQVTKHFTEKTIKEVWKEKLFERKAGRESDMCDFVCNFFQKRIGIMSAVVEMGYNLLYGLWKYAWDADCELFLRILQGEMKEEVYYQQIQLQEDLENNLAAMDRSLHGSETGVLTKAEVRSALDAFFAVGQPGSKTLNRFDELMQALDEDQDGPTVVLKKLFEEDREFNQGELKQPAPMQHEHFAELEQRLLDETRQQPECTRDNLAAAIMKMNPNLSEQQAQAQASGVFDLGVEQNTVALTMQRLRRQAVQITRPKVNMALLAKMKMMGSSMKKKVAAAERSVKIGERSPSLEKSKSLEK
ncbi:g4272 [Coccomyxa elongata]